LSHSAAALNYAVRRRATQGDRVFLSSITATSLNSWNNAQYFRENRLQEEQCSLDCFRKFDSRRRSRWSQRLILRYPGGSWKLLRS